MTTATVETQTPDDRTGEQSAEIALRAVRRDLLLSLLTRSFLAVLGLGVAILAVAYAWRESDKITAAKGTGVASEDVVAYLLPPAVLLVLAGAAGIAAWTIHARNLDETYRALDAASRMKRESEVAVSARGLVRSFEEKMHTTHRAFSLLLWFGRTLFIVSLGLFAAAVVDALVRGEVDWYTAALGAGSLVSVIGGLLTGVPRKVKSDLADVVQIQAIVTSFHRQLSLLETYALEGENGTLAHPERVLQAQERIDDAAELAAQRIARVEPDGQEETDVFGTRIGSKRREVYSSPPDDSAG